MVVDKSYGMAGRDMRVLLPGREISVNTAKIYIASKRKKRGVDADHSRQTKREKSSAKAV